MLQDFKQFMIKCIGLYNVQTAFNREHKDLFVRDVVVHHHRICKLQEHNAVVNELENLKMLTDGDYDDLIDRRIEEHQEQANRIVQDSTVKQSDNPNTTEYKNK